MLAMSEPAPAVVPCDELFNGRTVQPMTEVTVTGSAAVLYKLCFPALFSPR